MKQSSKKPGSTRDPMLISLKKLMEDIQKMQQKNLSKYSEIKRINPSFDYAIYKAHIPTISYENRNREQLSIAQDSMLAQIDKLMQDEEKLNIEYSRQSVKVKEYEKIVEKQMMSNMDHFTFLRKIWKKVGAEVQDEKIDRLIHNVGSIKGHILNLIKRENTQIHSCPQIHQLIISSPEYCHKVKQNEQLKQQLQKLKQSIPQANIYPTSQSSLESNSSINDKSQNNKVQKQKYVQLESMVECYRKQLEQKKKEIQELRIFVNVGNGQGKTSRLIKNQNGDLQPNCELSIHEGLQSPVQQNNKYANIKVKVKANDGIYEVTIKKISNERDKGSNGSISDNSTSGSSPNQPPSGQSKRTLQQLIDFLSTEQKRIGRTSMGKAQQSGEVNKRFTVQQITRAKFISNRQINASKTNDISLN